MCILSMKGYEVSLPVTYKGAPLCLRCLQCQRGVLHSILLVLCFKRVVLTCMCRYTEGSPSLKKSNLIDSEHGDSLLWCDVMYHSCFATAVEMYLCVVLNLAYTAHTVW